jgi:P27 family predicted phage terminase small subunit
LLGIFFPRAMGPNSENIRPQIPAIRGATCPVRNRPPTYLKVLRGNPGHQCLNKAEPQPEIAAEPEPPSFLQGYAADEWWRVAPELHRLGLRSVLDVMPLAAYCVAYKRWRTAEEALTRMAERDAATSGLLVKSAVGDARASPLVKVAAAAADRMLRCAGEFGLTPVARTRLAAGPFNQPPSGGKFGGLLA